MAIQKKKKILGRAVGAAEGGALGPVAACYSVMAPEKRLPAWSSMSLCVVIDQPVGNPKRKV
jgi:hypothetical protein